ncbi:hypothetical protein LR48_Vigan09g082400 [Vigna angularis]|uniref:Uncharacterized protein n=1 Tax=Phaseolus angularis TaxID=3914 RepID=A0A0L9VAR6_PHAAN|nr:hypothetical protein LR48_Vigan09g082400 [Vigna angularis]
MLDRETTKAWRSQLDVYVEEHGDVRFEEDAVQEHALEEHDIQEEEHQDVPEGGFPEGVYYWHLWRDFILRPVVFIFRGRHAIVELLGMDGGRAGVELHAAHGAKVRLS